MIRYALSCEAGHSFETWFRDSAAFDEQAERGLVACPFCGSAKVAKQIMAPRVARTDLDIVRRDSPEGEAGAGAAPPGPPAEAPPAPVALLSERDIAFRELVKAVREQIRATSEDVGRGFAAEARRMHEGASAFRSIYGQATPEEAQALADEGIDAVAIPWLSDDRH
ncbi:DUF1178 family protein [Alsobacter sp. KACC 23698]|uniref:DUF1178 family protein n=1 Tax=Alsobacter sp. KACC 23698 TaxID=3149229 RepID=A0AAU7JD20_9HYPH